MGRQVRSVGRHGVAQRLLPTCLEKSGTQEQKQMGWEMAVRIEKILCTVLSGALKRQVEETVETLLRGAGGLFQELPLD